MSNEVIPESVQRMIIIVVLLTIVIVACLIFYPTGQSHVIKIRTNLPGAEMVIEDHKGKIINSIQLENHEYAWTIFLPDGDYTIYVNAWGGKPFKRTVKFNVPNVVNNPYEKGWNIFIKLG